MMPKHISQGERLWRLRDKDWISPKFKDQPLFDEVVMKKYGVLYPEKDK
jgi:hypothetical protein